MRMPNEPIRRVAAWTLAAAVALTVPALLAGCRQEERQPDAAETAKAPAETKAPAPAKAPVDDDGWEVLFDGKTLTNWKSTEFGGEGKVYVKDGRITLDMANADLTGITWAGKPDDLPTLNYEIEVEAMRVDGGDFFCGLTFPYKDSHASLICGGWGGGLVGISSFNYQDAANNETSTFYQFENGQWYIIRLKVTDGAMDAWIDGKQVVQAKVGDRKVGVRMEVEASMPLGIATWHTKAAIRQIRLRRLLDR